MNTLYSGRHIVRVFSVRHALLPCVAQVRCVISQECLRSGLTWVSVKAKRSPNPTPTPSARFCFLTVVSFLSGFLMTKLGKKRGWNGIGHPCVMLAIGELLFCSHVTGRPCLWSKPIYMKMEFTSPRRETLLSFTVNMAAVTSRASQQWDYARDWVDVVSSCTMGLFCGKNLDPVSRAISLKPIKETIASKNIPIVHFDISPTQS